MHSEHLDHLIETPGYPAPFFPAATELDGDWDSSLWRAAKPATLQNFVGMRPAHFPVTQFRVAYDPTGIRVIFRVTDRYVRAAVKQRFQGKVWFDSCVEFFFTPGPDITPGYFNLEMNCGGAFLLHWQTAPRQGQRVADIDCAAVEIYYHLPEQIEVEITDPVIWTVEYRIPYNILEKYTPTARPAPGVQWRANFYKCADGTSHPHWLTYFPVRHPQPDFHRPEWFGLIEFTP